MLPVMTRVAGVLIAGGTRPRAIRGFIRRHRYEHQRLHAQHGPEMPNCRH